MKTLTIALSTLLFLTGCAAQSKMEIAYGESKCPDGHNDNIPPLIIRVAPQYPIDAARDNLEGYVQMEFDVSEHGSTTNINVTESFPDNAFVYSAKKALSKWKFKPAVKDGVAVAVECLNIRLDFQLGHLG